MSTAAIHVEDARILAAEALPADQHLLRLEAPRIAAGAEPGQFVHVRCDEALPMRRPLSILRADRLRGTVELLFKVVGRGTRLLARRRQGETLNLLGPIGRPFRPVAGRPRALLLGGGVGIPPMIFLAERMAAARSHRPLLLAGSEVPFPFPPRPSQMLIEGIPTGVIATFGWLEDRGVPCRLASNAGLPGCFQGHVTGLAERWLEALAPQALAEVAVYACGPPAMLAATAALARRLGLPCQVSLEEHMACGVGGCAGCTVPVRTPSGPAMRRVCVDGPVFDAADVLWAGTP
ncbi:dihydroorotate dehydrogenase electron transfer subunit [Inmirania thermothiophila]|uniref:Dihydroorotate oxidase B electron transfer subunit n=1 Tax=Inmirania thermothiophila TaxID=1750597 RepID=A0A3N1YA61_9GAMM|nr:dihydroorotate dehydrogenase electron transfer subunit [Inmirania thermothiophila]ROR34512.1 dihydroorotate oxidase B electron transfer subunit [Inmirania thermothiophila]